MKSWPSVVLAGLVVLFGPGGCKSEQLDGKVSLSSAAAAGAIRSTSGASGAGGTSIGGSAAAPTSQGWAPAARLGSGCDGLSVPNNVEISAPALEWEQRPELCAGCSAMKTPWVASAEQQQNAVTSSLQAFGSGPDVVVMGFNAPLSMAVLYAANGRAQAAFRTNYAQRVPCGRIAGLAMSSSSVGLNFMQHVQDDQELLVKSGVQLSELMTDRGTTLRWPKEITAGRGVNALWLSSDLAALDLSGEVVLGNLRTGAVVLPSTLGSAPGTFSEARLHGSTAFLGFFNGTRSAWWTLRGGKLSAFLGADALDIESLVTDGEVLVWKQGRDPVPAPSGSPWPYVFQHHDLMIAPYTEEQASLAPRILRANVPVTLGYLQLANGFLTGTYLSRTEQPRQGAALIVRLADGRTQKSELAGSMSWGFGVFPTESEIWGAVTSDPLVHFQTYARAPYASMVEVSP